MHDDRDDITTVSMSDDPPDWQEIRQEVHCPLCEYNLRGLIESRCPECGYRFTWEEVLDPRRRLHPYLYEHHPDRGYRAYLKTVCCTWLPRRFFQQLHPIQPVNRRKLIHFMMIAWGLYVLSLFLLGGLRFVTLRQEMVTGYQIHAARIRASMAQLRDDQVQSRLARFGVQSIDELVERWTVAPTLRYCADQWIHELTLARLGVYAMIYPLGVAWLCFATLLIFQQTMRRSRIKSLHVFRAIVYSFDSLFWVGLLMIPLVAVLWIVSDIDYSTLRTISGWFVGLMPLLMLLSAYRLAVAYSLYLRFPAPYLTVFLAGVIVFLAVFTGAVLVDLRHL